MLVDQTVGEKEIVVIRCAIACKASSRLPRSRCRVCVLRVLTDAGNFGVGIILLTICLRILMFPLANISFKSMNDMRIITTEIQRIKERFKDDRQKMNQEMFAMYKEKKINPAAGCLPLSLIHI